MAAATRCDDRKLELSDSDKLNRNEKGELKMRLLRSLIFRDMGGFGEKGKMKLSMPKPPADKAPDSVVRTKTQPNQALLYRLCADFNPLHVDP